MNNTECKHAYNNDYVIVCVNQELECLKGPQNIIDDTNTKISDPCAECVQIYNFLRESYNRIISFCYPVKDYI